MCDVLAIAPSPLQAGGDPLVNQVESFLVLAVGRSNGREAEGRRMRLVEGRPSLRQHVPRNIQERQSPSLVCQLEHIDHRILGMLHLHVCSQSHFRF